MAAAHPCSQSGLVFHREVFLALCVSSYPWMTPTSALHKVLTWVYKAMIKLHWDSIRKPIAIPECPTCLRPKVDSAVRTNKSSVYDYLPPSAPTATPRPVPSDLQVPHDQQLQLLGVLFDVRRSYNAHLRQVSLRVNSRLWLLWKASIYLSTAGWITTYGGFLRPLLEYTILIWMGAATTYLHQLDHVQRRAVAQHRPRCDFPKHCITPTVWYSQFPLKAAWHVCPWPIHSHGSCTSVSSRTVAD